MKGCNSLPSGKDLTVQRSVVTLLATIICAHCSIEYPSECLLKKAAIEAWGIVLPVITCTPSTFQPRETIIQRIAVFEKDNYHNKDMQRPRRNKRKHGESQVGNVQIYRIQELKRNKAMC